MIQLYSSDGCPYAQRARALLALREVPFELVTIDLKNKPASFLALSPTGRVPLLVDGERKLYESYVINEYLSDVTGWDEGLSSDPYQRARERLAMLQFDNVVVPLAWKAMGANGAVDEAGRKTLERELDELEKTVLGADARVNLLGLHVVTHVVRWIWMEELTPVPAAIARRNALDRWINELVRLPAVQTTLSARDETVATMRKMAGLV